MHQQRNKESFGLFEQLENRRLLSGVVLSDAGTLLVSGSNHSDKIAFTLEAGDNTKLDVVMNGETQTFNVADITGGVKVFAKNGRDKINVLEGSGAVTLDFAMFGGNGKDIMRGGSGDDSLDGGTGNDSLVGKAGDDLLFGGNGNDKMEADEGNDTCLGGRGRDNMDGGDGDDSMDGGKEEDHVHGGAGQDHFSSHDDVSEDDDKSSDDDQADDHGGDAG